jgi:toxin YoeB
MEIRLTPKADEDLLYWKSKSKIEILKKIRQLLENIEEYPFEGLGKPEALKHKYTGYWSRRINKEHRLIYEIKDRSIIVHSLRGHYK